MGKLVVSHVGKAYKRYPDKWARMLEWVTGRPQHEKTWVLRDIDFTVNPGEAVGIVGVNGAGKSTLLKIITGTTQPTSGSVHMEGRVAALLELGMGFHPDFTGRQNARMAGQLAGLKQEEIESLLPQIEKFADVGAYFDQPVRIYSSGMQARVAFAVATATTPDILIIDEALSVGDIAFQAKCMLRMQEMLDQGVAVLFVSHSLNQVRQFCSRALYLKDGGVHSWGPAEKVCDLFQNDLVGGGDVEKKLKSQPSLPENRPSVSISKLRDPELRKNSVNGSVGGNLKLEYLSFKIFNSSENSSSIFHCGDEMRIEAVILANNDVPPGAGVGLLFADKSGYHLAACNTNYYDKFLPEMKKGDLASVVWELAVPFALGEFRIDSGIKPEAFSDEFYDRIFCAAMFSVVPDVKLLKKNFGGYLFLEPKLSISVERASGINFIR